MGGHKPWWSDVLEGGLAPLRKSGDDGDPVMVETREHGDIDVVSERLKVAAAPVYADYPPLDGRARSGQWRVTSIVAEEREEWRPLLLRACHKEGSAEGGWQPAATTADVPPMLYSEEVLIGDGDPSLTLGDDEWSKRYADLLYFGGSPNFAGSVPPGWTPPDGTAARGLLPGSTVRSYYSGSHHALWSSRARRERAHPKVWVRSNADGQQVDVVVDLVAALWGPPYETCVDAWADPSSVPGGRLARGLDNSRREEGDLCAAFVADTDDFQGSLVRLGEVALEGEVVAFDPGALKFLPLPVSVAPGIYGAYAVFDEFADLVLLRFGEARPTSWYEWVPDADASTIPIDTGTYAIGPRALVDSAAENATQRALVRVAGFDGTPGIVNVGPGTGSIVINGDLGGDVPAWCYVGLDDEQRVVALVVALVNNYALGNMPSERDNDLYSGLADAVSALPSHHDAMHSWAWIRDRIEESGGRVTREARAAMYQLADELSREV